MHPSLRYSQFEIPKRSGGKRTISAPNKRLKLLQKRLAKHLHLCDLEIEKLRGVKYRLAHGFKHGQSILSNADIHRNRRHVLNVDLKDFFGTINFGRVRGFLIKNKDFALKPDVATIIAQIACHENALPQGSPCSPILSNLITNILDVRLAKLSKAFHCSYSRYADDLTFSTSTVDFPAALATPIAANSHLWNAGVDLEKVILHSGFTINPRKTRLQYKRSRQDVTGIVVNKQLNTRIEYRRTMRAMVHRLRATGSYELKSFHLDAKGEKVVQIKPGTFAQLEGMLNFARHVELWRQRDDIPPSAELLPSEKLMRQFLFYKEFAGAGQPAILFEGKTDSIYLREALRRLSMDFPSLVTSAASPLKLKIKLHRYTNTIGRLFGLRGGTGHLKDFIFEYPENFRQIKAPKGQHPVIILIDNDSGASKILNSIKSHFKVTLTPGQYYFHVVENLYVMLTSPLGSTPHYIEECFDSKTLAIKLGQKTFNASNDFDSSTEYGKAWFAERVIKLRSSAINFSGFKPLLTALVDLIGAHAAKFSTAPLMHILPASVPITVLP